MRKRLFIVLALMVCGIAGAWAGEVDVKKAQEIALDFVSKHNNRKSAPTIEEPFQVSGLYVFNLSKDAGYVIVSNDDQTTPILGFSDSGSIDPKNMPENMLAWLQGYADEIAWLQKNQSNGTTIIPVADKARRRAGGTQKVAIDPLIKTTWDQGEPYNDMTPYYGVNNNQYVYSKDYVNGYSHCATGCVATSMAQVMYYHNWPNKDTDLTKLRKIPPYKWKSNIWLPNQTDSLDSITFDWDKMLLTYEVDNHVVGTDSQKIAIATLMKYCGYSIKMDYGPSSGSNSSKLASALKKYFDYNETTNVAPRSLYSYAKWIDLIYFELQHNRPVIYGGQSTRGGHSFVCDGYKYENETDYFHINWGWGGQSDNYYVLSVLDPYNGQGTGGSATNDGFRYDQDAVIGIQKSRASGENSVMSDIQPNIINLTMNSMTLSHSSVVVNTEVTVTLNITNNNATDYDGTIYIGSYDGGYYLLEGDNFYIPARQTKDCELKFTPTTTGTYDLYLFLPNTQGSYSTNGIIYASLPVVDSGQGIPTNLAVTNITSTEAQLSWTDDGEASTWVVGIKANGNDFKESDADMKPFTLTNLSQNTEYTVKVRISGNWNWSPEFTFTTPATYQAPEDLTANKVTPTSALISWEGSADSYDVRYGVLPTGLSAESGWLKYEGDYAGSRGNDGTSTWTWGVMYPGSMVTGNKLTKIAFYETPYNTGNITVNIYSGGGDKPGTLKKTISSITPEQNGFHEIQFDEPLTITPSENLWITLTEDGSYPMTICNSIEPNNTWIKYGNTWSKTDNPTDGWMIRGYIESESINPETMTTISSHTGKSYSLENLNADNNYVVQVRSKYGSNYSDWVTATINKGLELSNDNANNDELIETLDTDTYKYTGTVKLTGRTLYKDGGWNTICLPFSLTAEQLSSSPLAGADIRTLTEAELNNGELTLNFTPKKGEEGSVTSITAGRPYLIKWDKATNYDQDNAQTRDIKDPVFNGVTIDKTKHDIIINNDNVSISFMGTYNSISFDGSEESKLLIGDNNMLYYPQSGARLGACRAYFLLGPRSNLGPGSNSIRSYVLNFGDDYSATGIIAIGDSQLSTLNSPLSGWYTLDGRKLNGKPTAKGVYVKNGKKIVIK